MSVSESLDFIPPNAKAIDSDVERERRRIMMLLVPSLVLIGLLVVAPALWLIWLSFFNEFGAFTFEHYARMFNEGAYFTIFWVTFKIAIVSTVCCIVLGYPVAYILTQLPPWLSQLVMLGVLMPFWTAVLVRTYAWLILLGRRGLVNDILISTGIIDRPIALVHNLTGTLIGMVHVLLPLMILPLYASMRTIDQNLVKASCSLGASPTRAFWTVFFPLSMPGLFAGSILVAISSLAYYATPALLGGGRVIMIAQRIESSVALYPSWGAASALGVILLLFTGLLAAFGAWLTRRKGA